MVDDVPAFPDVDYSHIEFHIRHADDPFIYVEQATADTLQFGASSSSMFTVGVVFLVVGALLAINPVIALREALRDRKEEKGFYSVVGGVGVEEGGVEEGGVEMRSWDD